MEKNGEAWADRIIDEHWDELAAVLGEHLLPRRSAESSRRRPRFEDFGCGHYGCVYPTPGGDYVLKITSDASEADFVSLYLTDRSPPDGIVRYEGIYRLPESRHVPSFGRYGDRPVYVVIREKADLVGHIVQKAADGGPSDLFQIKSLPLLVNFKQFAGALRTSLNKLDVRKQMYDLIDARLDHVGSISRTGIDWKLTLRTGSSDPERAAFLLQTLVALAQEMAGTEPLSDIGEAFWYYLHRGILLADVHTNNVGVVRRKSTHGEPIWVITDPGHLFRLHDGVRRPRIKLLSEALRCASRA